MIFFKKDEIPVDLKSFQEHVMLCLSVHFLFLLLFFGISLLFQVQYTSTTYYIVTGLYFALAMFAFNHKKPSLRYLDIYGEKFKTPLLILMAFFPPVFIAFYIHLCLKDKSQKQAPAYFRHYGYFSLLVFPLIALSSMSPKYAYWVAGPATYYVLDIAEDAKEILALSKLESYGQKSVFNSYTQDKSRKYSHVELLLLMAVSADQLKKQSDREVASIKVETDRINQKYGGLLLNHVSDALLLAENSHLQFPDYSIIQWINPMSAVEIMMINSVDESIKIAFTSKMAKLGYESMKKIEKKMAKLPDEQKIGFELVLNKARNDFSKSKSYRSIASEKK